MRQMKNKDSKDCIEVFSDHTTVIDTNTREVRITHFELDYSGELTEWIAEYLDNPEGSRLCKDLERMFRCWLDPKYYLRK